MISLNSLNRVCAEDSDATLVRNDEICKADDVVIRTLQDAACAVERLISTVCTDPGVVPKFKILKFDFESDVDEDRGFDPRKSLPPISYPRPLNPIHAAAQVRNLASTPQEYRRGCQGDTVS